MEYTSKIWRTSKHLGICKFVCKQFVLINLCCLIDYQGTEYKPDFINY